MACRTPLLERGNAITHSQYHPIPEFQRLVLLALPHLSWIDTLQHSGWVSSSLEIDQVPVELIHLYVLEYQKCKKRRVCKKRTL